MPKTTYARVRIKALSAWHTGIWQGQDDERVRKKTRTSGGKPAISANSLIGSLRSHIGETKALALLGGPRKVKRNGQGASEKKDNKESEVELVASPWIVLGAVTRSIDEPVARQRTPIDRARRAAGTGGLHDIEEVQPGHANESGDVTLYLKLEDAEPEAMLEQLSSWQPTLGGLISSGLGQAKVIEVRHRTIKFDMQKPKQFVHAVRQLARGPEGIDALLDETDSQERPMGSDVTLNHRDLPTLLTAKLSVPLLSKLEEDNQQCFQGSRWKGLIRSRIEYIGRTLGKPVCGVGLRVDCDEQGEPIFDKSGEPQFKRDEKHWSGDKCEVCQVLGSADAGVSLWSFGVSAFDEEHSKKKSANADVESKEKPVNADGESEKKSAKRIAINRFTGSVLETAQGGALFEQHYWPDVKLTLTIKQIAETPEEATDAARWVARALLHVLADINDGLIGIGGRTSVGMGTATVEKLETSGDFRSIAGIDGSITMKGIAELPVLEKEDAHA